MKQEQRALSESRGAINTTKSRDAVTHSLTRRRTTRATATSPVDASAARREYASSNARGHKSQSTQSRSIDAALERTAVFDVNVQSENVPEPLA